MKTWQTPGARLRRARKSISQVPLGIARGAGALLARLSLFALLPLASTAAQAGDVPFAPESGITIEALLATSVFAADVDGDGDVDVLSASQGDDKIAWYENDGASPPVWTAHTISTTADGAFTVFAADLDGDRDIDVVSGSVQDGTVAWYENRLGLPPPAWPKRLIITTAGFEESVFLLGIMDTSSRGMSIPQFSVQENPGEVDFHQVKLSLLPLDGITHTGLDARRRL